MTLQIKAPFHPKCGEPTKSYTYKDASGTPVLFANRFEKPDGSKFFMPYDPISKEWKALPTRPLYNLDRILAADPSEVVIFVEGEKCADALTALGFLATTTYGGSNAPSKSNLSALKARKVIIWPDNDIAGQKYAKAIESILLHEKAREIVTLPIGHEIIKKDMKVVKSSDLNQTQTDTFSQKSLHVKSTHNVKLSHLFAQNQTLVNGWDVADAIAEGWTQEDISDLITLCFPSPTSSTTNPAPDVSILGGNTQTQTANSEPNTTTTTAPDLTDIEVWKTPDGEPFATLRLDGHFEHWPIASATFKKFLSFQHYQATEKMLSQSALDDQRRTYEGQALFGSDTYPVFNRIGALGRTLYVDLGCDDWKAIAINSEGWQMIHHPPARFTRARSMQPLPHPAMSGGDINLLRPFLNTKNEADFQMLIAWLIGCFHPKGPYPILILNGEQGSAKSTTARVLRNLIDPANPIARSAPNSEQDLVIAAKHNHVLAFDNLSTIKPMMADAFCRIATGGGFGTRKLHTDADEMLFSATRPCLLNGIPDLAGRPDLADRAIVVTLPVIPPAEREFEGEFNKALDAAMPRILAGLLDAVSTALANLATVRLTERPRMADFAKWVSAAEPALGWT